jgi:quinol monooxygenase YgiN
MRKPWAVFNPWSQTKKQMSHYVEFRRREILGGLMATLGAAAWAAPKEKAMYGMIVKMTTAAGKRAEVLSLLLQAVTEMPGCLSYVVAQDLSDENDIWITEVWDSKESHDASLSLPEVRKSIAAARPMITGFSNQVITTPLGGYGLTTVKLGR